MGQHTPVVLAVHGGWPGHDPAGTSERVVGLLRDAGCEVVVSDSLSSYEDDALMAELDLVVQCWTMGEISAGQLQGLLRAVRSGTGLSGWHGGLCDAFRAAPEYQFMTGGQWVAHPGGTIEYDVAFERDRPGDAIIAGLADFTIRSEQYYVHVDPSNDVLATTTFRAIAEAPWIEGCVMPVVWRRSYGQGRVFYSSLGHDVGDFDVPQVSELVLRGSLWAMKRRVDGGIEGGGGVGGR